MEIYKFLFKKFVFHSHLMILKQSRYFWTSPRIRPFELSDNKLDKRTRLHSVPRITYVRLGHLELSVHQSPTRLTGTAVLALSASSGFTPEFVTWYTKNVVYCVYRYIHDNFRSAIKHCCTVYLIWSTILILYVIYNLKT